MNYILYGYLVAFPPCILLKSSSVFFITTVNLMTAMKHGNETVTA